MNTQIKELENVRKSCRIASVFAKIIEVVVMVCAVAALVGAIVIMGNSNTVNAEIAKQLADPENASFEMETLNMQTQILGLNFAYSFEDEIEAGNYAEIFAMFCIGIMIACSMVFVVFFFINKVLKSLVNSESPFSNRVLSDMKKSFIALVILFLVTSGIGTGVFLGVVLWGIYNIFQYGVTLQTQADETL